MRNIIHLPPIIADEFSGYLLVACSYLAVAWGWDENAHVRITLVVNALSERTASLLRVITLMFGFIFALLMGWMSFRFLAYSIKVGMRSASWLVTPLQVPHSMLIIGFSLLILIVLLRFVEAIIYIMSDKDHEGELR